MPLSKKTLASYLPINTINPQHPSQRSRSLTNFPALQLFFSPAKKQAGPPSEWEFLRFFTLPPPVFFYSPLPNISLSQSPSEQNRAEPKLQSGSHQQQACTAHMFPQQPILIHHKAKLSQINTRVFLNHSEALTTFNGSTDDAMV